MIDTHSLSLITNEKEPLKSGDALYRKKISKFGCLFNHWGMCAGKDSSGVTWIIENQEGIGIRLVPLDDFLYNYPYKIKPFKGDNRQEAINRAFDMHGQSDVYKLIKFNCEHFVNYCQNGKAKSSQVRRMFASFAFVILFLISLPIAPIPQIYADTSNIENTEIEFLYNNVILEFSSLLINDLDTEDINFIRDNLENYRICDKDNLRMEFNEVTIIPDLVWTYEDLINFENEFRRIREIPDDTLYIFIMSVSGEYISTNSSNKDSVCGINYKENSISIFPDQLEEHNKGALVLHEIGHILNLDHCDNSNCLMFPYLSTNNNLQSNCLQKIYQRN